MALSARALQGLAVGAATGPLGAALIDLQHAGSGLAPLVTTAAPTLGLGAGREPDAPQARSRRRSEHWHCQCRDH